MPGFLYINQGDGTLFDYHNSYTQKNDKKYSFTGMAFNAPDHDPVSLNLPNLKEIWVKFDYYSCSKYRWVQVFLNGDKSIGLNGTDNKTFLKFYADEYSGLNLGISTIILHFNSLANYAEIWINGLKKAIVDDALLYGVDITQISFSPSGFGNMYKEYTDNAMSNIVVSETQIVLDVNNTFLYQNLGDGDLFDYHNRYTQKIGKKYGKYGIGINAGDNDALAKNIPNAKELWIKFDYYSGPKYRWVQVFLNDTPAIGLNGTDSEDFFRFYDKNYSGITNGLNTLLMHFNSLENYAEIWINGEFKDKIEEALLNGADITKASFSPSGCKSNYNTYTDNAISNIIISTHRIDLNQNVDVSVKMDCDVSVCVLETISKQFDIVSNKSLKENMFVDTDKDIIVWQKVFADTESVIKARIDREHFCIDADVMASEAVNDRIYADTQSGVLITDKHDADLQANVIRSIAVNADTGRLLQAMFSLCADTRTRPYERHALSLTADVKLQVVATVDMCLDMLLHQIKEFVVHTDTCLRLPFDTTFYLPANTGDPYDPFIIPPAREKGGMVRMSIMLNELSLSDAFELETTMPVDVLDGICGTILDFRYHYIISETDWKDSTISASGMYDVDSLLFTPMRYSAGKEKHKASYHAERIAGALSKKLNIAIRDFTHSVTWTGGGQTYESIISSLFGWTSSVPHRQINVFLRAADNSINIIQRGYEKNIVDITGVQHTCPEYHRELVRTMWTQDGSAGTAVNKAQNINIEPMPFWGTLTFGDAVCSYESGYLASETVNGEITTYDYEGEPETGKYLHKKTVEHADGSITVTSYDYNLTNGGVKVLGQEEEVTTDKNGNRSVRRTVHAPLGSGFYGTSVYVDGDYQGSSISTGSPAGAASRYLRNEESITLGGAVYSGKEKDDAQNSSLGFIDTASFPVEEESILEELTNEIKWLNRRIKETVNMDIYNYPHVIDFSERIRFRGYEYYLVSNTITRTTRELKQAVSLVRWY